MSVALLQALGAIASAGLGALATWVAVLNPSERRLKRLERHIAMLEKLEGGPERVRIPVEVNAELAATEVSIDIQVSRQFKSNAFPFFVVFIASIIVSCTGLWLLSGTAYHRVLVGGAIMFFAYTVLLSVVLERSRLERARKNYREGLSKWHGEMGKGAARPEGVAGDGDVPAA